MKNILYISYDGLTDPLGQSQILAYLKRLKRPGIEFTIVSFEKPDLYSKLGAHIRDTLVSYGITWKPLFYTRKPPVLSTLKDIRTGLRTCRELHRQSPFDIIHCRGYIPSIIGRKLGKELKIPFIFDMRGWWADEKKESGHWNGFLYRPVYHYFKKLEWKFFAESAYAVSLTYKGKDEIVKRKMAPASKIGVIPTCVDFDVFKAPDEKFRLEKRRQLNIPASAMVFVYSGSLGGNYNVTTLIGVFNAFKKLHPDSYLLILSKDGVEENTLEQIRSAGITNVAVYSASYSQVTDFLRVADVGLIWYTLSFSVIGRSPTKLGEYWASGLPVISFKGIGDLDEIMSRYQDAGLLLSETQENWEEELKQLVFLDPQTLREYAKDYFDIDKGVSFYLDVYNKITGDKIESSQLQRDIVNSSSQIGN